MGGGIILAVDGGIIIASSSGGTIIVASRGGIISAVDGGIIIAISGGGTIIVASRGGIILDEVNGRWPIPEPPFRGTRINRLLLFGNRSDLLLRNCQTQKVSVE
ncbi:MAG: hypothetical protein ACRC4N_01800 [Gammaproteobacteria bacterium]